jgi:hypothetical protein
LEKSVASIFRVKMETKQETCIKQAARKAKKAMLDACRVLA